MNQINQFTNDEITGELFAIQQAFEIEAAKPNPLMAEFPNGFTTQESLMHTFITHRIGDNHFAWNNTGFHRRVSNQMREDAMTITEKVVRKLVRHLEGIEKNGRRP
jgi:hypothetical protein